MSDVKVKWFCCGICNSFLPSLWNYKRHFLIKHQEDNEAKKLPTPPSRTITIFPSQVNIVKLLGAKLEGDGKGPPHLSSGIKEEKTVLPCVICNMDFKTSSYLHRHIRTRHTLETPFHCSQCEKSFSRTDSLKSHSRMHSDKMYFSCKHCDRAFRFISSYNKHMSSEHTADQNRKKFQCPDCPAHFFTQGKLATHREKVHDMRKERKFQCNICPKRLISSSGFKNHILMHTSEKHFKCDHCSKTFTQKSNLTTHKKSHERNRSRAFTCNECDKSFLTKQHFNHHIDSVHNKTENFHCPICNKGFTVKQSMETHLGTHVAERHHRCQFCEKSFKHASSLAMHIRLHLGEKIYPCEMCGKGYTQRVNMEKHKRTLTWET